jgi:transcriptional antiterminator RfaH
MRKRWFVIQTKSKQEDRSVFHLRNKDIEVYLPKLEVMTFHARRRSIIRKPFFPCYLFVSIDPGIDLNTVRWTQGVVRILLNSIQPMPLDDRVIEEIRSMEDSDGIIRLIPSREYKKVRITKGPFKDLTGIFDRWLSDGERVKILLDLVFYQASIDLHPSLIERIA